ncbi:hypothetical protein N7539_009572 [Penicillium diatomitis]|uniref:endo-1,3(4)-beta-glucanase n=1 Tax=Penicillium diatomitis TaxID=2819901 RepID=A0A9X0BJB7_9EURO|nr:uncharacterized protein N7539_009572 [Penicillium diatomitis]KAJ5466616.1 hypothetical protein N7539_009572 [Penicillium diatomitis]
MGAMTALVATLMLWSSMALPAQAYPNYAPLQYRLRDVYDGPSFFDHFNYYSGKDPTDGYVSYVNKQSAQSLNLTYATSNTAILRVDASTPNPGPKGRQSVRIESQKAYDSGLFLFDIAHTPHGCGTWPALWMSDTLHWPQNGEIDIIESHNTGVQGNEISLHALGDCSMGGERRLTGTAVSMDCDIAVGGNAGCAVMGDSSTYGADFNARGGGVYALEIRDAGIRIWVFHRDSMPLDIANGQSPNPSSWGPPLADFPSTNCNIKSHFRNLNIIVNIDLCGEYAAMASHYTQMSGCPGSCAEFVATNPSNFNNAYWEFRSIRVYQAV